MPSEVDDEPLTGKTLDYPHSFICYIPYSVEDLDIVMKSTHTVTDWYNFGLVRKIPS